MRRMLLPAAIVLLGLGWAQDKVAAAGDDPNAQPAPTASVAVPQSGKQAPVTLPPGGAKALVEKTCGTGCHSVEVVTSQRMNRAEWDAVVQNMVARGAPASDAEVKVIVEYLAKTLGR